MIKRIVNGVEVANPIGDHNLMFLRTTDRYGQRGTVTHNLGYLRVYRDIKTGRFVSRKNVKKTLLTRQEVVCS